MNAYTPEGLLVLLAGGTGIVLLWVGVALGAGLGLYFIFTGIRAGVRMFRVVAEERYYNEHGSYRESYIDSLPDYDDGMSDTDFSHALDYQLGGGSEHHSGWIDTSGFDMGMDAPDVGVRPGK